MDGFSVPPPLALHPNRCSVFGIIYIQDGFIYIQDMAPCGDGPSLTSSVRCRGEAVPPRVLHDIYIYIIIVTNG